jgi:hypothetical protein
LIAASASEARTSIIASGGNFFSMCDYLQTLRLHADRSLRSLVVICQYMQFGSLSDGLLSRSPRLALLRVAGMLMIDCPGYSKKPRPSNGNQSKEFPHDP